MPSLRTVILVVAALAATGCAGPALQPDGETPVAIDPASCATAQWDDVAVFRHIPADHSIFPGIDGLAPVPWSHPVADAAFQPEAYRATQLTWSRSLADGGVGLAVTIGQSVIYATSSGRASQDEVHQWFLEWVEASTLPGTAGETLWQEFWASRTEVRDDGDGMRSHRLAADAVKPLGEALVAVQKGAGAQMEVSPDTAYLRSDPWTVHLLLARRSFSPVASATGVELTARAGGTVTAVVSGAASAAAAQSAFDTTWRETVPGADPPRVAWKIVPCASWA